MGTMEFCLRRSLLDAIPSPEYSEDDPPPYQCQAWPIQTPGSLPTQIRSRRLFIPDSVDWQALVNGALSALTDPDYYRENIIAGITPEEAARRGLEMFWDYVDSEGWMIGTITPYATENPPPYTLPCDGKIYNRVDYPLLYAAIDPFFRLTADTFIVPQLIGRVIVGSEIVPDEEIFRPGATGGEFQHALTVPELATHTHTDAGHTHTEGIALPSATVEVLGLPFPSAVPGAGITGVGVANIQPTGSGTPHNNMQPYMSLKYAIYYR